MNALVHIDCVLDVGAELCNLGSVVFTYMFFDELAFVLHGVAWA